MGQPLCRFRGGCIMNEKVETWLCGIMFVIGMGALPIFLVW